LLLASTKIKNSDRFLLIKSDGITASIGIIISSELGRCNEFRHIHYDAGIEFRLFLPN
jgi:hypothetical protein